MIDVLDRRWARGFVHKKLLGEAVKFASGFVPGGSTALGVASSLTGRGGASPPRAGRLGKAGRKACRASGGTLVKNASGSGKHCVMPGQSPSGAMRPPSIPPVNPVRTAVITAKPVEPIKQAPPIRRRVPAVLPGPRTNLLPAVLQPRTRTPIRSRAMPIHAKARRVITSLVGKGAGDGCILPARRDPLSGDCRVFIGEQSGRDDFGPGEPVMGRYGAAYFPGSMIVDRAICLSGDVVGDDGLCYPKKSLKNSEREWPRGRRPLLTGGDMRAISIANRAAVRLTRAAGRLQDMGLIKKPIVRKQIKKKN